MPANELTIRVQCADYNNSVEFARILCAVLDEELMAKAFTHTDGNAVEVECVIHGPQDICHKAVDQLSEATADAFKMATVKIGGIDVKTQLIMNKKSSYQPISLTTAGANYRKFLLKFV